MLFVISLSSFLSGLQLIAWQQDETESLKVFLCDGYFLVSSIALSKFLLHRMRVECIPSVIKTAQPRLVPTQDLEQIER